VVSRFHRGYGEAVPVAKQLDDLEATRRYYDEFAERYDDHRGGRVSGGYHDLVDELEMGFLERFAAGREVLEVGCGTGLLLERMRRFAATAVGVDLSPGMLERARARGLDVHHGSVTALPFGDASFDVVCSFKVLAHVREIHLAMSEMLRVLRPGGALVVEFYNRRSLRALVKRLGPARAISARTDESAILTRYDTPAEVASMLPPGCFIEASRGVRIMTPLAGALSLPGVGPALHHLEQRLCDGPLAAFGGFWIAAIRKP
jgi:ubiquinone/menaquinone biosynthesis C-methylase UbiE